MAMRGHGGAHSLAAGLDGLSARGRLLEAEKEEIRNRLNSSSSSLARAKRAGTKNTITPLRSTPSSTLFHTAPATQLHSSGRPVRASPTSRSNATGSEDDHLPANGHANRWSEWHELQEREQAKARERARARQEAIAAAVAQDYANRNISRRVWDKSSPGSSRLADSPPHAGGLDKPTIQISDPQLASVDIQSEPVRALSAPSRSASLMSPHVAKAARPDAAAATPEAISIQRESSLTKNMISPIVRRTPQGSMAVGHGSAWPEPTAASLPGPDFQNYERLVAQRDAKIGILEKQVEVLQGALREKGLDEAEQTLTGLLSTGDHVSNELTQVQAELEEARKETQLERENVDKLKKKQLDDIAELRKMYEDVVHERERHREAVARLEEELRQKDEALLTWQRSHGELENELDQTIVKVTQLQKTHSSERESHMKEAETFHKSMLEHTKQLDAVRRDRDNVAAELHELKGVLDGHEGVVTKMQTVRKEEERAREWLSRELEATQAEANKLREEVVLLQNQAATHKASMRHEIEARRQLESSLHEMKEAREKLESAWATKLEGMQRATADAEQALQLQTKRANQTRDAHDSMLEMLRTELSQATTDCRDAQHQLERMTSLRDQLQEEHDVLSDRLSQAEAECARLGDKIVALEASQVAQDAELQDALEKLSDAQEQADSVKRDYAALEEAGAAKDTALRSELAEVHRRAAANERAANDALVHERRDREKECAALREEIFSLRETSADRADQLLLAEQQRDSAESMLREQEVELESSRTRELEALARVDQVMKDFSVETSALRCKVTELSSALREAEDSRLSVGQSRSALESEFKQEQRKWQSKCWDLEKQLQAAEDTRERERQNLLSAASLSQSVIQQGSQLQRDLRQFEVVLQEEQYRQKQVHRQVYTLKMEEAMRNDELQRSANELKSLCAERDILQQTNEEMVEKISARDKEAGVEGFTRGVEACQAEIRAQAERTRETTREIAQMKIEMAAKDNSLKQMEGAMQSLRQQRSELETLLAMERAARAAVEKASVNLSRSNVGTPLQTPSRTATRSKSNVCGNVLELPSPLLEDRSPDVLAPPRAQVLSYASADSQ